MNIRLKLTGAFVFLIVMTALLYGLATYDSITKPLRSFEERTSLQYSGLLIFRLNEILEHAKEDVGLLTKQDMVRYIRDPEGSPLHHKEDQFDIFRPQFLRNAVFVEPDNRTRHHLHAPKEGFLDSPVEDLEISIITEPDPTHSALRIARRFYGPDGSSQGEGFIFLTLERLLNTLVFKQTTEGLCLCLRDGSGELLYSTLENPVDEGSMDLILSYMDQAIQNASDPTGDPFQTTEILDKKGRLFLIGAMVPALGAFVFIEPDYLGLEAIISSMSVNMLMIGLAIVWITIWLAWVIGYRIIKPIEDLSQSAERIASGEYDYRLEYKDNDEIGHLARKFNQMTDAVEKRSLELEQTNKELKDQDLKKTRFLDIVAHDLRTPLTSIKAFSDLLLRFPNEDEKTKTEFLEIIIKESDRMASLITDYLDLTKLESGTLLYRFRKINLEEMIRDFERINRGECSIKKIRITTEIKNPLPPLQADPDRLSQVFSNLLSNAIRYSPPGGEIRIEADRTHEVEKDRELDWVEVSVSDQGPGIPEKYREKIFDKFRQLNNQGLHAAGGTGLGLPISREIITKHAGRIWLETNNEKGAIFKFRIPVAPS